MPELISINNASEYERFVASHPKGHFMQSVLWAGVKDNWKWEGVLSRNADGTVRGALGLLIRRVPGLPFTLMYGGRGPVCDVHDRETLRDLFAGARQVARRHHAFSMKLDPDVLSVDTAFADLMRAEGFALTEGTNFEGIQPRYVFRLDIADKTEDEVFALFTQKTRYNIRLATRRGVEVRLTGPEMLPAFSRIMLETGVRDGFVTRPQSYFEKLMASLGEHARLYMAFYEGEPVAGTLAIRYGDKVWYLYGASSNESRNVMPNYLLQWHMIQWAIESGCRVYDFRGVSGDLSEDNPLYGLYRFKRGFGGDFCEFTGEWDLVLNRPVFLAVRHGERLFRSVRRTLFLKKNRTAQGADSTQDAKPAQDPKPADGAQDTGAAGGTQA